MLRHIPFLRDKFSREDVKAVTRLRTDTARGSVQESAATLAHARERFARDAHDLVGHWLLLASLKGELACRRAGGDVELLGELTELLRAVRSAAEELRDLAAAYHRVTLAEEAAHAVLTLNAMGVTCTVRLPHEPLSAEISAVLGTVVREGVTNLLRHSRATACAIEVRVADGWARLTVDNDGTSGARSPRCQGRSGRGLGNLHLRARELGGRVVAVATGSDTFRLTAEVPVEHTHRPLR